jgi:transposase-like protein
MNSNNGTTEISVTEGARRATGVTDISAQKKDVPESEVRVPIKRPRHTENYKQEVVARVAELRETGGEIGSYLRTKGLYFSTVKKWANKLNNGSNVKAAGSKEKALNEKVKYLEKELERTRKKLEKSELIIEFQKKISRLLEQEEEKQSLSGKDE